MAGSPSREADVAPPAEASDHRLEAASCVGRPALWAEQSQVAVSSDAWEEADPSYMDLAYEL